MCTTISPFGPCGSGQCLNGTCVCSPGVGSIDEFYFEGERGVDFVYCDYIPSLVAVLNWMVVVATTITLAIQLYVIQNRRQLKRLSPLIAGLVGLLVTSCHRLAKPEEALFIDNIFYTAVLANSMGLFIVCAQIFFYKYFKYMLRTFNTSERTNQITRGVMRYQYVMGAVNVVNMNLWVVAAIVADDPTTNVMLKVQHIITSTFHIFALLSGFILLNRYLSDMRELISRSKEMSRDTIDPFVQLCKSSIPAVITMRGAIIFFNGMLLLVFIVGIFLPWWLKQWTYIVPLVFLIWEGVCLTAIWAAWTKKRKKKQLDKSKAAVRVVQLSSDYALSSSQAKISSSPVSRESRGGSFRESVPVVSTAL